MQMIKAGFEQAHVPAECLEEHIGGEVRIHGSIYKIRRMQGFAFVLLRCKGRVVQCVWSGESGFPLERLRPEACVVFTALVAAEPRAAQGLELRLRAVEVLSGPAAEAPVVINNKRVDAGLETLLNLRPLTLRNERQRAVFRIQAALCAGLRGFLEQEGFTEVHTPKLVFAGAEGGANQFGLDYFGRQAYLAQSPQFYKQMLVGVFERVYEIGPVFRAEKHDTARHLNEYTSVDLELGYIQGFEDIMRLETALLGHALRHTAKACAAELTLLGAVLPQVGEIPALRFMDAKRLVAETYGRETRDFEDFEPEEERLLCEAVQAQTGSEFVFVTHYPSAKRPFYAMDDSAAPGETLSFDLLFRGVEITTGGQRIHDYAHQLEKLRARGLQPEAFESYLMAHRYGLPPHGGLGLGLERLTARLLGLDNLREATLFPRDAHRLEP